jgi:transcription factor C subunit 6
LSKLFQQRQATNPPYKLKVIQHEFRSVQLFEEDAKMKGMEVHPSSDGSEKAVRGAARILHGFVPQINDDPRREITTATKSQSGKKRGRPSKGLSRPEDPNEPVDDTPFWKSRLVIHDPLTKMTAAVWNPNKGFACWAAVAMGSGLVRVMDLGQEP